MGSVATVLGLASLGVTLWVAFLALQMRNKKVVVDVHPICGLSTVIASVILVTLGLITLITRKCCKIDWQTHSLLSLGRVHRYMAYATLILAQVSITVGIVWYY